MDASLQDKIFLLSRLAVSTALQSLQKERSLRFRFRELKRSSELLGSGLQIARPHFEFTEHRIEQVIGTQFTEISNALAQPRARLLVHGCLRWPPHD